MARQPNGLAEPSVAASAPGGALGGVTRPRKDKDKDKQNGLAEESVVACGPGGARSRTSVKKERALRTRFVPLMRMLCDAGAKGCAHLREAPSRKPMGFLGVRIGAGGHVGHS